jgi:hypothetical protein
LDVLPLVVDITNPSPALGFRNQERQSFLDRVQADAVFALALVHHLLITARVPPAGIRDLFHGLTRRWLVIEFVDREDVMFQTLLALREDLYQDWNLDRFLQIFQEAFVLEHRAPVPGSGRHLLTFRKK